MKNVIAMIFTVVCVVLVLYGITRFSKNESLTIRESGDFVIGKVELFGSDVKCFFEIDGESHEKRASKPHSSIKDGELYKVYYNVDYPDKYYVSYSEPVIIDSLYAEAVLLRIKNRSASVFFEYEVAGKKMSRYQWVSDSEAFTRETDYKVFYNKNDIDIAYLVGKGGEIPPF